MRREILMPALPPSTGAATIARWHVSEGQAVAAGDVLAEIATANATLEIEAENEGHVERILVPAGTEGVKVNTPIAILFGAAHAPAQRPAGLATAMTFASLGVGPLPPADRGLAANASTQTYREALRDALAEEMRGDPTVLLIGTDVAQNRGAQKVGQGLLDEFGAGRVVAAPPVDEALFGTAVGAALGGLKPVVEVAHWGRALEGLAPYLTAAAETFYLSGGTLSVPIVFRGPSGFVPGLSGQESRCVAALLAQIPGLKVVQPATPASAKALLKAAIRDPGPVAVLEHELLYAEKGEVGLDVDVAAIGAARIASEGDDVTIAAAGRALVTALEAARHLSAEGIEAEVIDLMSIRPLDVATVVRSVSRTGRLVTVEEGGNVGGIGAELAAVVSSELFGRMRAAPLRIAGADVPMPYAAELQAAAIPDAGRIVAAVQSLVGRS